MKRSHHYQNIWVLLKSFWLTNLSQDLWSHYFGTFQQFGLVSWFICFIATQNMEFLGTSFTGPLPSGWQIFRDIVISILCEEIGFYYSHRLKFGLKLNNVNIIFRLFHHPKIYKYIHKKHHEWTAPVCKFQKFIVAKVINLWDFQPSLAFIVIHWNMPFLTWVRFF